MGLFNALMGNASEINIEELQSQYAKLLAESEQIERAYKLIRDLFLFTNKRLILVNVQGVTGKKIDYHSIPYKNITQFSIETGGDFDLDAELKIWVSSMGPTPIEKKFNKSLDIYKIQSVLAQYVLK